MPIFGAWCRQGQLLLPAADCWVEDIRQWSVNSLRNPYSPSAGSPAPRTTTSSGTSPSTCWRCGRCASSPTRRPARAGSSATTSPPDRPTPSSTSPCKSGHSPCKSSHLPCNSDHSPCKSGHLDGAQRAIGPRNLGEPKTEPPHILSILKKLLPVRSTFHVSTGACCVFCLCIQASLTMGHF